MLESPILDVAIGLVFVYLLLAVCCSTVSEWISQLFRLRPRELKKSIERLLPHKEVRETFLKHPLIKVLGARPSWLRSWPRLDGLWRIRFFSWLWPEPFPSYIHSETFALALLDVIAPANEIEDKSDPDGEAAFNAVREAVKKLASATPPDTPPGTPPGMPRDLPSSDLEKMLLVLLDSGNGKLDKARAKIEDWFDGMMGRVSGWYKRKAQVMLFVLASLVTVGANVDTISFANALWKDAGLRKDLVAEARKYLDSAATPAASEPATPAASEAASPRQDLENLFEQIALQVGWSSDLPKGWEWLRKVAGLLLTAIAVSFGAPFWFDVVGRFVKLRATGEVLQSAGGGKQRGQAGKP